MLAATTRRFIADDARYAERSAYNAAFYELGLQWHWDAETYDGLHAIDGCEERMRNYLQTHQAHLLTAYDVDFLVSAIETTKARFASGPARRQPVPCQPAGRAAEIGF